MVRTIRRHFRRRDELWVHDISTMPSYPEWDGRFLRAEYTVRAPTRAASVDEDKALSVLSPNQLRLPQQLRQLGDIDRDPARLIAR